MMNRTLSTTVLGLLVLVASGMVTGGAAQPPAASSSGVDLSQVADVAVCLAERNHGACVDCCKEATGLPGNICTHFCKAVVPPPPEPQPEPQP